MLKVVFENHDLKWLPTFLFLLAIGGCSAPTFQPTPSVAGVSCKFSSYLGKGSDPCTVTLSGQAGFGGLTVTLASSSDQVKVPVSISVPIGVSSATFTAAIDSGTTAEDVTLTARVGSGSVTYALRLGGKRPEVNLSTTSLSFGDVPVHSKTTKPISFKWTGSEPLKITYAKESGSTSFVLHGPPLPATLPPNETVVWNVDFTPSAAGTATGTLTFAANSSGTDLDATVALTGSGVASSNPSSSKSFSLSSSAISFGDLAVNSTATRSITAKSTGEAALTISSAKLSGSTSFKLSGPALPATLAPGQSSTWQVAFDPTASGAASATVAFATNADSSPSATVALSGTGIATSKTMTLSTSSIAFGNLTLNSRVTRSIVVKSTGQASLTVSSAKLSGSSSFSLSGPALPAALAPGQSATWTVAFDPSASGLASGAVAFATNADSNPSATVILSGTGVASTSSSSSKSISLSSSSIAFGDVAVKSTATQSITAKSTGQASLTISSAKLSGSTSYSLSGPALPASLAPGQSATWEVEFAPSASGAASGTLAMVTNSDTNPNATVTLTGTGTAAATSYKVNLTWTEPSGSSAPIAGYHVYRATKGSSNYALLNSSIDAGTSYTDENVASGTTYDYYVESVNTAGISSGPSTIFAATIP
jgi:hypothetical protein